MTKRQINRLATVAIIAVLAMPVGPLASNLALAQTAQPAPAATPVQVPQPDQGVNWPGAGYGAAALLGNVLYIPAKLVYAIVGGFVGGATWLVTAGNTQTADTVWRSSLGGDYVLTPQMVAGEQPINFSGPTGTEPVQPDASAAPATGAVQPITPVAPAASAAPATTTGAGGAMPMDSGSGPVGGSPSSRAPALPNTSIE